MILKYIEAEILCDENNFIKRDIEFDEKEYSIILPHEYVKTDLENHIDIINDMFFNELIERNLYSSLDDINNAIVNNKINVYLNITYCNDISKSDDKYNVFKDEPKSLNQVNRYCSGIQYTYCFKTKEIERYEIYGNLVLGDRIKRDESYYDQFKPPKNMKFLNKYID